MELAFSKVKITPREPAYLCGYSQRKEKYIGIHDDLFVLLLRLRSEGQEFVLACYDLLMLDPDLLTRLTDTLMKYQLDPDHIILSTTCTHSGVEYAEHGIFGNQETGANPSYRDWLVQKTEEAYLAAQPWIEVDGFYAVKEIEGCFGDRIQFDSPCDRHVHFIQFVHQGHPVCLLTNLSCYPTVLGPDYLKVSADLFGAVREQLEQLYHVPVFLINGAQGNVSNRYYRKNRDEQELERLAQEICGQLADLSFTKMAGTRITVKDISYSVETSGMINDLKRKKEMIRTQPDKAQKIRMEELIPILDAYIAQCKTSTQRIPTRLLIIGDVVVITVGGALFTQFSIQIKAAFKAYPVFIWGLTDASVGYLVAEEEYGENSEAWLTRFPKGIAEQYIQHVIDECSDFIAFHFKTR